MILAAVAGGVLVLRVPFLQSLLMKFFGGTKPAASIVNTAAPAVTVNGSTAQTPVTAPYPLLQDLKDLEQAIVANAQQKAQDDLTAFRKGLQGWIKTWGRIPEDKPNGV